MKHIALIIAIIGCLGISGCSKKQKPVPINNATNIINIDAPIPHTPQTYIEILSTDIKPILPPDYTFPTSHQYENGCFVFAIRNVLKHKYSSDFDPYKAEKTINKPRNELWSAEHIKNLLTEYDIRITWQSDTETFFNFLKNGEPVIIQYKYKTSDTKWIGHFVAAYSFDKDGVWISDSISGQLIKIPFKEIFRPDGLKTQFGFATIKVDTAN